MIKSMDRPYNILLLDDSSPVKKILDTDLSSIDKIICLFWASDGTIEKLENKIKGKCIGLKDIIGDLERWEKKASDLSYKFCSKGPVYKGIFLRSVILEDVYHEALYFQLIKYVINCIKKIPIQKGIQKIYIHYSVSPKCQSLYRHLTSFYKTGFSFRPLPKQEPVTYSDNGYIFRLAKRAKEIFLAGGLKIHLWHVFAQLDKTYEFRCNYLPKLKKPVLSNNRIIFFSSYFNNSKSLKAIEGHLRETPKWIFLNESARQGASPLSSAESWLWNFSGNTKKFFPLEDKLDFSGNKQYICFVKWISQSPVWQCWTDSILKSLGNLTKCWEYVLENLSPEFVFIANQWGIEGWITKLTQAYGVPTIQLMHGILGGYFYTKTPVISDAMITYGKFWKNLWPDHERTKIFVYNPGHIKSVKKQKYGNLPTITFFSWPLKKMDFYNFDEFYNNIAEIIYYFISKKICQWIIRFHPAEDVQDFVGMWTEKYNKLHRNLILSKREPLSDILEKTDIAIMFRSTVMLNCMASSIPIIIPGWINFGWNRDIEGHKGIYPAKNMEDMKNLIINCLNNNSEIKSDNFSFFLDMQGKPVENLNDILRFTKGFVKNAKHSC